MAYYLETTTAQRIELLTRWPNCRFETPVQRGPVWEVSVTVADDQRPDFEHWLKRSGLRLLAVEVGCGV